MQHAKQGQWKQKCREHIQDDNKSQEKKTKYRYNLWT